MTNVAEQRLHLPPSGTSREELRREMEEAAANDPTGSSGWRPGPTTRRATTCSRSPRRPTCATSRPTDYCPRRSRACASSNARWSTTPPAVPRPRRGREHHLGRIGEHPDGRQVRPRPRPRASTRRSPGRIWSCPSPRTRRSTRRPTTSGWLSRGRRSTPTTDRYRRLPGRDRRRHGPAGRLRAEPDARDGRPDRGACAARPERDIGFHVDSCVGGFFLPFVEKLG